MTLLGTTKPAMRSFNIRLRGQEMPPEPQYGNAHDNADHGKKTNPRTMKPAPDHKAGPRRRSCLLTCPECLLSFHFTPSVNQLYSLQPLLFCQKELSGKVVPSLWVDYPGDAPDGLAAICVKRGQSRRRPPVDQGLANLFKPLAHHARGIMFFRFEVRLLLLTLNSQPLP